MKEPKIGMYCMPCCLLDLYKIETEEQVQEIIEDLDEMPGVYSLYDTLEEAIKAADEPHLTDEEKAREFKRLGYTPKDGTEDNP